MFTEQSLKDANTSSTVSKPKNAFQCSYCQRAYGRLDHLARHVRTREQIRSLPIKHSANDVLAASRHKGEAVQMSLLSQAEHGPDTPAQLITNSENVGKETLRCIEALLEILPTADVASISWKNFGEVIVADTMDEVWAIADEYASEHVQILTKNPREALIKMTNYGALFLGRNTCVPYGDKVRHVSIFCRCSQLTWAQCIGTNHVLLTRKAARYTGGLWVGKFLRTQTYQEVRDNSESGDLGRLCGRSARAENFEGHARSGDLRAALHHKDQIDWIHQSRKTLALPELA